MLSTSYREDPGSNPGKGDNYYIWIKRNFFFFFFIYPSRLLCLSEKLPPPSQVYCVLATIRIWVKHTLGLGSPYLMWTLLIPFYRIPMINILDLGLRYLIGFMNDIKKGKFTLLTNLLTNIEARPKFNDIWTIG